MQTNQDKYKTFEFFYKKAAEIGYIEASKLIECRLEGEEWLETSTGSPVPGYEYRIKPETVQHKGGEYPKPLATLEEARKQRTIFVPKVDCVKHSDNLHSLGPTVEIYCPKLTNDSLLGLIVECGLAYAKKEDAIARAKVIFELED